MKKTRLVFIPDFMVVLKEISLLEKGTMSDIHLKTGITYSHLHHMKKDFLENDWIIKTKEGVKDYIHLTELGKDVVNHMTMFFNKLGVTKDNLYDFRRRIRNKKIEKEPVKEDVKEPVKEDVKEPVKEDVQQEKQNTFW